jgi:hypothetical protein
MQRLSFRGLNQDAWGNPRGKPGLRRVLPLKKPCYVAHTGVMQSLHKNEILLFMDFQDFLARKQKSSLNSKTSKGIRIPMEALYGHLPKTPSHTALQKVRG